ncbi:hypothetical protein CEXT_282111 [Caerostris extrusa]|uniref:Uncharacterized protein n=1 Tax=Caerostris extrusa TaxID=172846 RepID=A0AAV4MU30_CAEEX|nr:hypothetical protein CEXT_282111 [Caerostris extrusa]
MSNFFRITPVCISTGRRINNNNNIIRDFLLEKELLELRGKNRQPLLKLHHCERRFTGGKSSPTNSSSKEGGKSVSFSRYHLPLVAGHSDLTPPRVQEGWLEGVGWKKWPADKE